MFNPLNLIKLKGLLERFSNNHPKLIPFGKRVYPQAMEEGTLIEISVTQPDGRKTETNLKLSADDMAIIREAEDLMSAKNK